ncbi:MAG: hypothetical protein SGI96_13050 [Bacteroidota bacterium]|nr:hypothetical protein [Bacteroidota bacterium]
MKSLLHHLFNNLSQHHQSIIGLIIPGLAKADTDTIVVIELAENIFPGTKEI